MDEAGAEIRKQSSVGSDSNGEEAQKQDGECDFAAECADFDRFQFHIF